MGNTSSANKSVIANISQTTFRLEVPNISKLGADTWSPVFIVRGTWWKFKIFKYVSKGKPSLGVILRCAEKEASINWLQVVSASVKLLPFSDNVNPIEDHIEPYIFRKSKFRGIGLVLVEWCELFNNKKGYVKDDMIMLEFKVEAANRNENFDNALNITQIGTSFRVTVKSIVEMMAICSPSFKLLGTGFRLTVFRSHSNQIGIRLGYAGSRNPKKYPIQVTMRLKVSGEESPELSKTEQMMGTNLLVMYFEDEWLKSAQAQNRPTVVDVTLSAEKSNDVAPNAKECTEREGLINMQCAICMESITHQEVSFTPCGHLFCSTCISNSVSEHNKCPSCNTATTLEQVKRFYLPM